MVLSIWQEIAWAILTGRLSRGDRVALIPDIFRNRYDSRRGSALHNVVKSILDLDQDGAEEVVLGFIHPSIFEYLVAADLAEKLKQDEHEAAIALEQDTWFEVNEFAQRLIGKWNDEECIRVAQTLREVYESRKHDNRPKGLLIRNKACYYSGRLGRRSPIARGVVFDFLDQAWEEEQTPFVRQSIGFARSIGGQPGAAHDFIAEMRVNDELDRSNRGYHLVYYGDQRGQSPPYRDPGNVPWSQTREALLRRISDTAEVRRQSRAVDLFTFLRFLQTRHEQPTDAEMCIINSILREASTEIQSIDSLVYNICKEIVLVGRDDVP